MEPESHNYESSMELPQPEEVKSKSAPEHAAASQPETRGMQMVSLTPQTQAQNPTDAAAVQAHPQSNTGATPVAQTHASTDALMADDADLIEKEWVTKAKAIVMQTKDDPHAQNKEMNKVKADYLKKRYNKDLKTSEG